MSSNCWTELLLRRLVPLKLLFQVFFGAHFRDFNWPHKQSAQINKKNEKNVTEPKQGRKGQTRDSRCQVFDVNSGHHVLATAKTLQLWGVVPCRLQQAQ